MAFRLLFVAMVLASGAAHARSVPSVGLGGTTANRFPQPVRVGSLIGERVLQPLESQPTLGFVDRVVREGGGQIDVVVNCGGVLGFFARPVAVPVEAMVLRGPAMEVVDLGPAQLRQLPTFNGADATVLAPADTIRVGLARSLH